MSWQVNLPFQKWNLAAGPLAYPGYTNRKETDFFLIPPSDVDGERTQNPNQKFREKAKSTQEFLKQKIFWCEECVCLVFKSLKVTSLSDLIFHSFSLRLVMLSAKGKSDPMTPEWSR